MRLAIQLMGTPQFQLDDVPVTAGRRAVVALLAYLVVNRVEHPSQQYSRESLAALLWSDYEQSKALANLRHTLWEVTKFIGEDWIIARHETIFFNPDADLILDVAQFRSLLFEASRQEDPALRLPLLQGASKLYRADFLNGFSLKEGPIFNEWALTEAENLRRDLISSLLTLIGDYERINEPLSAIPYAQRLIALDSLNEDAYRKLMHLYALTDQPAAAIQLYHSLERLTRKEFNLDPQPETRELFKSIRKGERKPVPVEKTAAQLSNRKSKQNLPITLTNFIGRETETDEIKKLIKENRLVTLIGTGGIGKTRLAIQTGYSFPDLFADGVWFVPLESLSDKDLVPNTVASYLNIPELPDEMVVETLLRELRDQTLLLILDNCEHLLDACAELVERLLKACPNIRILATSREALRVEGEAIYQVPVLSTPSQHEVQSVDKFLSYESIRLFLERARLVSPSFEITKTDPETVLKICNRLDGIPLAIELAASHLDIFTPEEILRQLNQSFDLLVSNTRSVLPRHQTMHTSIDWGWNLLAESERTFLRDLSVFIGGWTFQAAQAMGIANSRELTGALVKKSFVTVHQQAEHETRYGFHEVIRAYALDKLRESGEEPHIRDLQLEYFVALIRQLDSALQGIGQDLWLERLFVEQDNIRTALEWAARTDINAGLYISNRLLSFWEGYERREEARWLLTI